MPPGPRLSSTSRLTEPTTLAPGLTLAELGERVLIERIHAHMPPAPPSVAVGIGDDAAVVEVEHGTLMVVTTDALVESIHFERSFTDAADIGYKALAVSLSDLAAMGAMPRHAVLSLALPATFLVADVDALVMALLELAARHRTTLVGGNITSSSGPLFIEVTAFGSVKRRRVLTRAGAKPGDAIYVSGAIGGAAAGLQALQRHGNAIGEEFEGSRQRYLRPLPRVRLGTLLGRNRATRACIDLSDGLADAIRQLATASRVGALLEAEQIPVDPLAHNWFQRTGVDPLLAALKGGEDYELLFAVPTTHRGRLATVRHLAGTLPLTRIGVITKERDLLLRRNGKDGPLPGGYEHFKA